MPMAAGVRVFIVLTKEWSRQRMDNAVRSRRPLSAAAGGSIVALGAAEHSASPDPSLPLRLEAA
jgi:hypothetical protein